MHWSRWLYEVGVTSSFTVLKGWLFRWKMQSGNASSTALQLPVHSSGEELWARWSLASALTSSAFHFQAPWKLATYNSAVLLGYPECNNAILMQHLYIAFYINISNNGLQYSCINMCTFGLCSSVHVFL